MRGRAGSGVSVSFPQSLVQSRKAGITSALASSTLNNEELVGAGRDGARGADSDGDAGSTLPSPGSDSAATVLAATFGDSGICPVPAPHGAELVPIQR